MSVAFVGLLLIMRKCMVQTAKPKNVSLFIAILAEKFLVVSIFVY
jgi:hypothetical protein